MTAWITTPDNFIVLAGLGQLCLALGSLAIPWLLGWPAELARVRPLTRQVFWVYALYIWSSHMAFAALSVLASSGLTDGSVLATCVTAFIAVWWGARLVIQFTCLSRSDAPQGSFYRWAEAALVICFVFFTSSYTFAAISNFRGLVA
jgi:hypothetical protein